MATVNLIIKGKVQGVYYRIAAKEAADKLGITGWVQYINEGRVEIMATGTKERLDQFIEWCGKGPKRADVTNVIVTQLTEEPFDKFSVIQEAYPHDI
jgi:acylphosphatase